MDALQAGLALASGSLVGFTLGLVGGGGSVLAVPLLVYLVGITNPHVAIGTSAVAVAANAFLNLVNHGRKGKVKWRCAGCSARWLAPGSDGKWTEKSSSPCSPS